MRKTMLLTAAAVMAVCSVANSDDLEKMPPQPQKALYLTAVLAPEFGGGAMGWIRLEAKELGGTYFATARFAVSEKDFKLLGIDPANGYNDEQVVVKLGNETLKMTFMDLEITGPVFMLDEAGQGPLPVGRGDHAVVFVNGTPAASGKF